MDSQLAIVEANGFQDDLDEVTTCRLYDIAMTRQEEDDDPVSGTSRTHNCHIGGLGCGVAPWLWLG
jgi:hypothetical protein